MQLQEFSNPFFRLNSSRFPEKRARNTASAVYYNNRNGRAISEMKAPWSMLRSVGGRDAGISSAEAMFTCFTRWLGAAEAEAAAVASDRRR